MDELTETVQLPAHFQDSYFTTQLYGLVEHHVRQIFTGLRGWFDGTESSLFPTAHTDRHTKLIAGFGGPGEVLRQSRQALADDDLRWALELATWLVRSETDSHGRADAGSAEEREHLGAVLRTIAQRTTAANVRNWCLTRALELEGKLDIDRHRVHRMSVGLVMSNPPKASVEALRMLVDPLRSAADERELRWDFTDAEPAGLLLRNGVAVATSGETATMSIALDLATWAQILGRKLSLSDAIENGAATPSDDAAVRHFFSCFDHPSLADQGADT